jgi:hypothetical protein
MANVKKSKAQARTAKRVKYSGKFARNDEIKSHRTSQKIPATTVISVALAILRKSFRKAGLVSFSLMEVCPLLL